MLSHGNFMLKNSTVHSKALPFDIRGLHNYATPQLLFGHSVCSYSEIMNLFFGFVDAASD